LYGVGGATGAQDQPAFASAMAGQDGATRPALCSLTIEVNGELTMENPPSPSLPPSLGFHLRLASTFAKATTGQVGETSRRRKGGGRRANGEWGVHSAK